MGDGKDNKDVGGCSKGSKDGRDKGIKGKNTIARMFRMTWMVKNSRESKKLTRIRNDKNAEIQWR